MDIFQLCLEVTIYFTSTCWLPWIYSREIY